MAVRIGGRLFVKLWITGNGERMVRVLHFDSQQLAGGFHGSGEFIHNLRSDPGIPCSENSEHRSVERSLFSGEQRGLERPAAAETPPNRSDMRFLARSSFTWGMCFAASSRDDATFPS